MIYAVMPVKNEAERYLWDTLGRLRELGVRTLVCDDSSTDDTLLIAEEVGVAVSERPLGIPSFLQHEGYFRQWCWTEIPKHFDVSEGDWIVSIDADEFLTGLLGNLLDQEDASDVTALKVRSIEIWGQEDGFLYRRVDGFWNHIEHTRFARWQDRTPLFPDRKMASGCVPMYATKNVVFAPWVNILHFGYMRTEDRREKSARYTEHSFGHNPRHVESILHNPKLEQYKGWTPCLRPA